MRLALGVLLATVVFIVSVISAAPPPGAPTANDPKAWEELTPAAIERVKKGEIVIADTRTDVEGGGQALIKVAMIFDVNIKEAYRIIRETDKQCEYIESCDENILIERTATYDIVEFHVKILSWQLKYRVKHQWNDAKFTTWWALDPTFKNDLKHLEGYWKLYYLDDNHTLARYGTKLIVKEFIPKAVQEALTRRDLPKTLEAVRKRVNTHGAYKKKGA